MRKEQKFKEQLAVTTRLKQIGDKLFGSEEKHRLRLSRVMSEARVKNNMLEEKVSKWKE